jgi:hypothetical protein
VCYIELHFQQHVLTITLTSKSSKNNMSPLKQHRPKINMSTWHDHSIPNHVVAELWRAKQTTNQVGADSSPSCLAMCPLLLSAHLALPASARTFAPAPCLALPASNPRMLAPPPPLARLGFVSWCFLFFLSGLREKGWIRKGTNVFSSARFNFFCLNLEI